MKYALIYRKNRGCTLANIYSGLRCRNHKKVLCTDGIFITLKYRQVSWQAQRNTGAESQVGVKTKDSVERTPCQGPFQGCPRRATIAILHAWKPSRWVNETTPFGLRGFAAKGYGEQCGRKEKNILGLHKTYCMLMTGNKDREGEGCRWLGEK